MTSTNKTTSTPQTDSPDDVSEVSNLADLNSGRQSSVISSNSETGFSLSDVDSINHALNCDIAGNELRSDNLINSSNDAKSCINFDENQASFSPNISSQRSCLESLISTNESTNNIDTSVDRTSICKYETSNNFHDYLKVHGIGNDKQMTLIKEQSPNLNSESSNVNSTLEHNSITKHSFENIPEPNLNTPICEYESESCLSIFDVGSTEIAPYTLVNSEQTGDSGKQNRVKFPEKGESVFPEKEAVSEQYFANYDAILKQNNNNENDVNLKQSDNNEDDTAMNHSETENFTLNFSDSLNENKIYQTNNSIHKAYEVKWLSKTEKSKLKETSSSLNCDTIYNVNPFSSFKGFSYKRSQTKSVNETEKSFTTTLENYNETQTKMESYKTENFATFSALPKTRKSNETFCNLSSNNASIVKIESNSTDSCSAECRSLEDNAIEKQPKECFHNLVQEKKFSLLDATYNSRVIGISKEVEPNREQYFVEQFDDNKNSRFVENNTSQLENENLVDCHFNAAIIEVTSPVKMCIHEENNTSQKTNLEINTISLSKDSDLLNTPSIFNDSIKKLSTNFSGPASNEISSNNFKEINSQDSLKFQKEDPSHDFILNIDFLNKNQSLDKTPYENEKLRQELWKNLIKSYFKPCKKSLPLPQTKLGEVGAETDIKNTNFLPLKSDLTVQETQKNNLDCKNWEDNHTLIENCDISDKILSPQKNTLPSSTLTFQEIKSLNSINNGDIEMRRNNTENEIHENELHNLNINIEDEELNPSLNKSQIEDISECHCISDSFNGNHPEFKSNNFKVISMKSTESKDKKYDQEQLSINENLFGKEVGNCSQFDKNKNNNSFQNINEIINYQRIFNSKYEEHQNIQEYPKNHNNIENINESTQPEPTTIMNKNDSNLDDILNTGVSPERKVQCIELTNIHKEDHKNSSNSVEEQNFVRDLPLSVLKLDESNILKEDIKSSTICNSNQSLQLDINIDTCNSAENIFFDGHKYVQQSSFNDNSKHKSNRKNIDKTSHMTNFRISPSDKKISTPCFNDNKEKSFPPKSFLSLFSNCGSKPSEVNVYERKNGVNGTSKSNILEDNVERKHFLPQWPPAFDQINLKNEKNSLKRLKSLSPRQKNELSNSQKNHERKFLPVEEFSDATKDERHFKTKQFKSFNLKQETYNGKGWSDSIAKEEKPKMKCFLPLDSPSVSQKNSADERNEAETLKSQQKNEVLKSKDSNVGDCGDKKYFLAIEECNTMPKSFKGQKSFAAEQPNLVKLEQKSDDVTSLNKNISGEDMEKQTILPSDQTEFFPNGSKRLRTCRLKPKLVGASFQTVKKGSFVSMESSNKDVMSNSKDSTNECTSNSVTTQISEILQKYDSKYKKESISNADELIFGPRRFAEQSSQNLTFLLANSGGDAPVSSEVFNCTLTAIKLLNNGNGSTVLDILAYVRANLLSDNVKKLSLDVRQTLKDASTAGFIKYAHGKYTEICNFTQMDTTQPKTVKRKTSRLNDNDKVFSKRIKQTPTPNLMRSTRVRTTRITKKNINEDQKDGSKK
ncbi:uncharacterized protein CDAR_65041 [Caerostris darwini]|uniref:Uncharacterized protein n=1 Tax=Caerostris darwini TaxID=1538125 RepID=A0AAV4VPJ9_9ARAC|nr:uncharacterized protein CDAR_65041 [Caerostris darwini]